MDGQVSGLGTVHPLLTLSFFSTWIRPLHAVSCCVFNVEEDVIVICNGWTPKKKKNQTQPNVVNIIVYFVVCMALVASNLCKVPN